MSSPILILTYVNSQSPLRAQFPYLFQTPPSVTSTLSQHLYNSDIRMSSQTEHCKLLLTLDYPSTLLLQYKTHATIKRKQEEDERIKIKVSLLVSVTPHYFTSYL